jgi:Binding-protein-dependent transport system inner membrane component
LGRAFASRVARRTLLGWLDSLKPLVVPAYFGSAFYIFLMRQVFLTIPRELDESALIDGANRWDIFARIIIPLSKPIVVTILAFSFVSHWNDFFGPLIYLNHKERRKAGGNPSADGTALVGRSARDRRGGSAAERGNGDFWTPWTGQRAVDGASFGCGPKGRRFESCRAYHPCARSQIAARSPIAIFFSMQWHVVQGVVMSGIKG